MPAKKKKKKKKIKRTTLRSRGGKKLYAVRKSSGEFKDIQTYKKAHGQDLKRSSEEERKKAELKSKRLKKSLKAYWDSMKGKARETRIRVMVEARGIKYKPKK